MALCVRYPKIFVINSFFIFYLGLVGAAPDISGFLDDKKSVLDRDPDITPYDDVRHYAYEGDGNTSGSLSSLASCKYLLYIICTFVRYRPCNGIWIVFSGIAILE